MAGWAKIAAYVAPDDPYAPYYWEALDHAGIDYERITQIQPGEMGRTHVLLLMGYGTLKHMIVKALIAWMDEGGHVVASGSMFGFEEQYELQNLSHVSSGELDGVKFYGGTRIPEIVTERESGKGAFHYFGPHVGQTIAQMQFGTSVEGDARGLPDLRLDNGVARAEDGPGLSYEHDRGTVGDEKAFLTAHADRLRARFIETILDAVDATGLPTALVWHWPNNAEAVYTVSVDCEEFATDQAIVAQRLFGMYGCRACWLIGKPGFHNEVYRSLRGREDEIGLLFEPDVMHAWSGEQLRIDTTSLTRMSSALTVLTARPVDGGWFRRTAFYDYCEDAGIRMAIGKGGRQKGAQGFLFGTCHPYFYRKHDGTMGLVAEQPYQLFRAGELASDALADAILKEVAAVNGCMHLAYHIPSFANLLEINTFRRLVSLFKEKRWPAMTPGETFKFEKARRHLRRQPKVLDTDILLEISSDTDIDGLTLLITDPARIAFERSRQLSGARVVERYGRKCLAINFNIEAKAKTTLLLRPPVQSIAA